MPKMIRDHNRLRFMCPGCKTTHEVTPPDQPMGWQFNGDFNYPTLHPSVLVTGYLMPTDEEHAAIMRGEPYERKPMRCHSFVRAGDIEFLNDCSHELAGKTVALPDME